MTPQPLQPGCGAAQGACCTARSLDQIDLRRAENWPFGLSPRNSAPFSSSSTERRAPTRSSLESFTFVVHSFMDVDIRNLKSITDDNCHLSTQRQP